MYAEKIVTICQARPKESAPPIKFVDGCEGLGSGSGWVLLTSSPRSAINQWANGHAMTVADGHVLLALDMYEHAYHMDYGAKAAAYVDAFMGALDWSNADKVFAAAMKA